MLVVLEKNSIRFLIGVIQTTANRRFLIIFQFQLDKMSRFTEIMDGFGNYETTNLPLVTVFGFSERRKRQISHQTHETTR